MDLFDLHCDTLYECLKDGKSLYSNNLAISLEKGNALNNWCQTFAVFTPDDLRGNDAVEHYKKAVKLFKNECKTHSNHIVQCKSKQDILDANAANKCAAILSVESGAVLNCDIYAVDRIIADGVKIFGLTWNGDNELASGIFGTGKAITDFGAEVINKLQKNDVIIDVSHLNERGFWQLVELTQKPIIATHSNLRCILNHKRNLTDEQFAAICNLGGVVGINYYNKFLGPDCFDKIYANISQMLEVGGEDHIALGSDFDGCDIEEKLNSIEKTIDLFNYLLQRGLNDDTLNKLCYLNALNLFK